MKRLYDYDYGFSHGGIGPVAGCSIQAGFAWVGLSYEFDLSSCRRLFDRLEDDGQISALGFGHEHMDVLEHHRRKQVCANLTK
jgi:hypothetical protein